MATGGDTRGLVWSARLLLIGALCSTGLNAVAQPVLGERLPDLVLRTAGGQPAKLSTVMRERPAVLLVLTGENKADCTAMRAQVRSAAAEVARQVSSSLRPAERRGVRTCANPQLRSRLTKARYLSDLPSC
jgi:hypothetical protein